MLKIKFQTKDKIIALDGKKQIGYLNFCYAEDSSQRRNIEIPYMYVNPEYRKQGIGSKMLKFLIENKPKITWLSFWTGKEIEKTKGTNFYLKNGFKKLAYHADYYEKGIGMTLFAKRISRN